MRENQLGSQTVRGLVLSRDFDGSPFWAINVSRVRVGPNAAECPYRLLSLVENTPASAGRGPNGVGWNRSIVTSPAAKTLLSHTSHPGQPRHRSFPDFFWQADLTALRGRASLLCVVGGEVASKTVAGTFLDDGAAHAEAPPSTNGTGPVVETIFCFPNSISRYRPAVLTALAPQTSPPPKSHLIQLQLAAACDSDAGHRE